MINDRLVSDLRVLMWRMELEQKKIQFLLLKEFP